MLRSPSLARLVTRARHTCARLVLPLLTLFTLALTLALAACGGAVKSPEGSADPQLVTLAGGLSNRFVKTAAPGALYARLRIGTRTVTDRPRGPVNLALVIDTSGSMEGAPIEDARRASLAMIDALAPGDRLAVVAFGSKEHVLLPATELTEGDRAEVKKRIQEMRAEGTTDMARGLAAGVAQVRVHLDPAGINRVVLLGDGVPNEASTIGGIAQSAGADGITITALGLGPDFDETLMGQIAQLSGGRFHYIDDSQKVAEFFQNEVLRLHGVYAKNTSLRLTPGPGVHIAEVLGQQISRDGPSVIVTIGDVSKGDSRDLVVRLATDPRKASSAIELLDAVLTFDDATAAAGRLERSLFLGARSTPSDDDLAKGRDPEVELSAALIEAAATTVAALDTARNGNPARAREMLLRGADLAEAQARRTPSPELEKQAANMRGLATDLPKPTAQAPSPSPAAPEVDNDIEAPRPSAPRRPGAASPASAMPLPAALKVREAHDNAMQYLQ